jgi:glycine/D-amino acid oxidase-like deaminating enzyme
VTSQPTHLDVLVVGAGISGISAGYHLQTRCPGQSADVPLRLCDTNGVPKLLRSGTRSFAARPPFRERLARPGAVRGVDAVVLLRRRGGGLGRTALACLVERWG